MRLTEQALADFTSHVLQEYPREAVGLLIDGNYIPCRNVADDPTKTFTVHPQDYLVSVNKGELQAVLHSHPYDKFNTPKWPAQWPTTADMEGWLKSDVPWGICATDGEGITQLVWLDEENPEPLEGREFIHGVNDCYSAVRDWFRLNKGIVLPNFARGTEWWYAGKNLYDENFEKAGFKPIPIELAEPGDCVMMQVASPVTNHAAVISGNNQIFHHVFHRLSGYDSLSKWNRCIVRAVRYVGDN